VARLHSVSRFVVVLALVASTQGLLFAQAAWLTNREWIASVLCENPGTDCNGMCQLKDRMEEMTHHGEHSHQPATLLELSMSVRAWVAERPAVPADHVSETREPAVRLLLEPGREASLDVFHPPREAAA